MVDRSTDERWDIHTERQLAVAKGGATAITVLNTGSWFALLSQVGEIANVAIGGPILIWATGAFLGTFMWLLIYRATALQYEHDFDRSNKTLESKLDRNIVCGISVAVLSLLCFAGGAVWLALSLGQSVE